MGACTCVRTISLSPLSNLLVSSPSATKDDTATSFESTLLSEINTVRSFPKEYANKLTKLLSDIVLENSTNFFVYKKNKEKIKMCCLTINLQCSLLALRMTIIKNSCRYLHWRNMYIYKLKYILIIYHHHYYYHHLQLMTFRHRLQQSYLCYSHYDERYYCSCENRN